MSGEDEVRDTVLIVDDDVSARRVAETALRSRGLHVLAASDAAAACDVICCEGAAVVMLNLARSGMKGFELLRRIRGRFETRTLPMQPRVVIVTNRVEAEVERFAAQLGADAFLRKPLVPAQVVHVIEQLLPVVDVPGALAQNA
jgi:CheY-like chemotaxis protein